MRLLLILALVLGLQNGLRAAPGAPALVLTLEGPVQWLDGKQWQDVGLGQLFGPGDQLRCGEGGRLLLSLDADHSLALEPGTALQLAPADGCGLALAQGRVALLSEDRGDGPALTLRTPNALVRVLGPDLEVYAGPQDTQVTVSEGRAQLGDLKGKRSEEVGPLQRRRLTQNRLLAPEVLAKREIFELSDRWDRARQFHGQRAALRRSLLASPDHAGYVRALKRRAALP